MPSRRHLQFALLAALLLHLAGLLVPVPPPAAHPVEPLQLALYAEKPFPAPQQSPPPHPVGTPAKPVLPSHRSHQENIQPVMATRRVADATPAVGTNTLLTEGKAAPTTTSPASLAGNDRSALVSASVAAHAPDRPARCRQEPKPVLPALSRSLGETGKVGLRFTFDEQGRVESIRIYQSSGFDRLDQAALKAAAQWQCQAPLRQGVIQAAEFDLPVIFELL